MLAIRARRTHPILATDATNRHALVVLLKQPTGDIALHCILGTRTYTHNTSSIDDGISIQYYVEWCAVISKTRTGLE